MCDSNPPSFCLFEIKSGQARRSKSNNHYNSIVYDVFWLFAAELLISLQQQKEVPRALTMFSNPRSIGLSETLLVQRMQQISLCVTQVCKVIK